MRHNQQVKGNWESTVRSVGCHLYLRTLELAHLGVYQRRFAATCLPPPSPGPVPPGTYNVETRIAEVVTKIQREIMKSMGRSAGYDELMEASQNTPLQPHILNTFPPSKFSAPNLQKYDRSTDPHDHICQYKQVLLGCNIPPTMIEEMLCKLFS